MSEEENIDFQVERAYLEMARSFFHAVTHDNENKESSVSALPPNVMWGLVATTYAMSYASVVAFLNSQFREYWDNGTLKEKYPDAESLDSLLTDKKRLGSLRTALKIFCDCAGKKRISESNSKLWNELIQVVETNRHYVTHPKPSGPELKKFFKQAMEENTWCFAPRVAAEVIGYFYDDLEAPRNDWLRENQDFSFPVLKLHKKQIT